MWCLGRRVFSSSSCLRQRKTLSWRETAFPGVLSMEVPKPWKKRAAPCPQLQSRPTIETDAVAHLIRAKKLIPDEVLNQARQMLPRLKLDLDPDSVDGHPTFEIQWIYEGKYTHAKLEGVFRDTIETKLVPMIRNSPLMPKTSDLVLCQALLRVYEDGQRLVHPAHFDANALVTAVLEIDTSEGIQKTEDGRSGFQGRGFYVQPSAHVDSRVSIVMDSGDVCAHSFDLQHGVEVTGGKRCSVIFWFTDSATSCKSRTRPWLEGPAAAGDPDAQYNFGKGLIDTALTWDDRKRGRSLIRSAAMQGHFMAQNDLGALMLSGKTCPENVRDLDQAEHWFRMASKQGFQKSMVGMYMICTERGQPDEALQWLARAAEQRADPSVMHILGMHLLEGTLSAAHIDEQKARFWLTEAAEMGQPEAQLAMVKLEHGDKAQTRLWLKRATDQGNRDAAAQLAWLYTKEGKFSQLARLIATWFTRGSGLARIMTSSKWSQ